MPPTLPIPTPHPRHGPAATPMAFIQAIVLAYQRYGANPANALAQAHIASADVSNPQARVTATQMEIISAVAMQELDDEALGWFSRKLPWGSYGMLCRASLGSPNLGVALKRWCRHHRLLTDDIVLHFEADTSRASIRIAIQRDLGAMQEFCLVSSLRYLLGYACWAIDSRIALLGADFPFAAPKHHDVYPLLFPGPIQFNAAQTGICFDAQYLALPLRRNDHALHQMLQRALPLTVRQYRRDRLLVQRLRQLLRSQPNQSTHAAELAERLHLSVRTLHRQLQEEGASLQHIKDEVRRDAALELLNRSTRSIKQIAQDVGFRNEKSFTRAFKHWTGASPSDLRAPNP